MASVALVVDHPQRDLLGLALVAYRLCAEGVTCHLVPARMARLELAGIAPDVVLLNHLKLVDEPIVEMLSDIGSRVAVLDTEGGVIESFDTYERGLSVREDLRRAVDCYCAWGPVFADKAAEGSWFPAARRVVTGPPRFDYYCDPWRPVVPAYDAPEVDQNRPAVLLAGTFTLVNSRFLSVDEECRVLEEEAHQDRAFIENRLQVETRCLEGMVELANELARWAPDVQWIYRPHPFERRETYEEALRDGVSLCSGGSIQSWLLSVDGLIQRGSTTAVEAALAGPAVLSPDWLPEWLDIDAIHLASTACADIDAVKRELEPVVRGSGGFRRKPSPAAVDEISRWFHTADGRAHQRVVAALLALLPDGKSTVDRDRAARWFVGAKPESNNLPVRTVGRVKLALGLPRDFSFARMRRVRGPIPWDEGGRAYSLGDVTRILDLLGDADAVDSPGQTVRPSVNRSDAVGAFPVAFDRGRSLTVRPRQNRNGA